MCADYGGGGWWVEVEEGIGNINGDGKNKISKYFFWFICS